MTEFSLDTPFSIGVKRYVEGVEDAHGNVNESWTEPENVLVYSIAPASLTESSDGTRDAVISGLTVLAPPTVTVDAKDVVVIDGDEYEVAGDMGDWNRGPFGFTPGNTINLRKVSG